MSLLQRFNFLGGSLRTLHRTRSVRRPQSTTRLGPFFTTRCHGSFLKSPAMMEIFSDGNQQCIAILFTIKVINLQMLPLSTSAFVRCDYVTAVGLLHGRWSLYVLPLVHSRSDSHCVLIEYEHYCSLQGCFLTLSDKSQSLPGNSICDAH